MRSQEKQSTLFPAICATVFVLTEFFGSKYFGPLSLRNYAVLFCLALPILLNSSPKKSVFKSFKYLILYYAFVMVLGVFNDLYLDDIGKELVLARFVPMIAIFILITSVLKNHQALVFFIYCVLFVLVIDAVATILQGTGNVLGWVIRSYFSNESLTEMLVEEENSIGWSFSSGISGTVVSNGFLLASLGLLYWVPYYENKTKVSLGVSFFLWLLFLIALFYNQQRMAFYVFLLFSTLIPIILSNSKRRAVILTLGLLVVVLFLYSDYVPSNDAFGRLSQVTGQDVAERHMRHNDYFNNYLPLHFFWGDRNDFVATHGYTPHNMIIETLLLGGIVGLLIYLFFVFSFLMSVYKVVMQKNTIAFLYSLPIIAVLLISWEHSSGFHTGMTLGAFCLALFELTRAKTT